MTLTLIDLVPQFVDFWQRAADQPREQQIAVWNNYVAGDARVVDDITRFGPKAIDPNGCLDRYPILIDRININMAHSRQWLEQAAADITNVIGEPGLPLRCVTLVGLDRSFGWVSVHDGEPYLFIPLEKIEDATDAGIVIRHEMSHLAQIGLGGAEWLHDERLGLLLYSEGYAPLLTSEIWPQWGMARHIRVREGGDAWYAEALSALPVAIPRLRGLLEHSTSDVTKGAPAICAKIGVGR